MKGARSMGLYIPSKNSTSILISLSSHPLASFQNGLGCTFLQHPASHALLTAHTPCKKELVCGACIGTAQVGTSLVAPLDSFFKRSSLRSPRDIIMVFVTCRNIMTVSTWKVCHTFHVDTIIIFLHATNTMMMSRPGENANWTV